MLRWAGNNQAEHGIDVVNDAVKLPNDRILIPGVITHHTITVEHPQLVADRIIRIAKIVGKENVIAGCDCGFAQAKFDALRAGANIASKELWGR